LPALIEEEDPALRRVREVERIQQSIIRRRQKKLALLGVRLAFFVGLPTLLAGWYFYNGRLTDVFDKICLFDPTK